MSCKEIKVIVKKLESFGYEIKLNKGHYKVRHDNKTLMIFSSTPSDSHAIRNINADIKKLGCPVFS